MNLKTVFTTGDVAAHCHVSQETVTNWIKRGQLVAYSTPGRHRRILPADFQSFLLDHGMPPVEGAEETRDPGERRVLVVDDEPDIVSVIVNFLKRDERYVLATAADGFDAGLKVITFNPDLVILDLMMPYLDGFSVCERIKSSTETSHIKVLIITGYTDQANVDRALNSGADFCLTKPFRIHDLQAKVEELFSTSSRRRDSASA
jgi:excisionase family DNA binding protein